MKDISKIQTETMVMIFSKASAPDIRVRPELFISIAATLHALYIRQSANQRTANIQI